MIHSRTVAKAMLIGGILIVAQLMFAGNAMACKNPFMKSAAIEDTSLPMIASNEGEGKMQCGAGKCGEGMSDKCGDGKSGKCGEGKEGKCGEGKEGKCGEGKEGKCGEGKEGKCGEGKEGKCGGDTEMKCGQGKCGSSS